MELVEGILSASKAVYAQAQEMRCCKRQKERLVGRLEVLLRPIRSLQTEAPLSEDLRWMLERMLSLLKEAQALLEKYKAQKRLERFLWAGGTLERFADLNQRLGDLGEGLLLQMQAEEKARDAFRRSQVCQEGSRDLAEDKVALKEMLTEEKADLPMDIRVIEKERLARGEAIVHTEKYQLCKGEYYKSPVAVKVFKNPQNRNTQKVRKIFEEEIRTLKKLDSPYILRMYGICIDGTGLIPEYSIVMEYCEKGSLREVLKEEPDLSWDVRTEMASDAAAGIYRLHQAGDKGQLHRCINSANFLVAKGYCVKLSGFKLEQTESSISGKVKDKTPKEVSSSAYVCPEGLASLNHTYDQASEIYSFGIVLWEIATGKIPFAGCTSAEICKKVLELKCQEPLGDDCPSDLAEVINQCRAFEPSKRPSAEDIVNRLLVK
ncbi:mixed lineage kinase domain-like protein [Anolis carolinensis]|uniref:mixed lineage kinase domain-like protein n=1 Tax=Anolis carolinensis TaxID=28377 RepID=UPI002F2B40D2